MKCKHLLSFFLGIAALGLFAASTPVTIRQTENKPFDAKGRPVASVWKNAHLLTGFSIPGKAKMAIYQSEAKMLFDKDNLYITLERYFEPKTEYKPGKKTSPFAMSNVEVFIRPDLSTQEFFQICAAPGCDTFTAASFRPAPIEGLKVYTYKKNYRVRMFNFIIPLKSIGLAGAKAGQKIAFNLCGANFDMLKGYPKEESSFAVLENGNYRIPASWEEATFSNEKGEGKVISGSSKNLRLNLLANSDFKYFVPGTALPVAAWNPMGFNKSTFRREVMALSNDWYIHANNKSYPFLRTFLNHLDPNKEYTLRLKARCTGSGSQMGIELYKNINKKYTKVGTIKGRLSLTSEFVTYNFTFKPKYAQCDLMFYRYGSRTEECGLDIKDIELFEGRTAVFEIRTVTDTGLKALSKGTERPIPANPAGLRENPMKVLAFTWMGGYLNYTRAREILEIFAGTGTEVDILCGQDKNTDVFYTKNDPASIQKSLLEGKYDLYLVCSGNVLERIGKQTASLICKNVEKGAVLVMDVPKKAYNFDSFLKKYPVKDMGKGSFFQENTLNGLVKKDKYTPDIKSAEVKAGKGKIYSVRIAHRENVYLPRRDVLVRNNFSFPYEDYVRAYLFDAYHKAAGKTLAQIRKIEYNNNICSVQTENTPENTLLTWKIISADNSTIISGEEKIRNNSAKIDLKNKNIPAGKFFMTFHSRTSGGKVLDYAAKVFSGPGAIFTLEDLVPYYRNAKEAKVKVTLSGGDISNSTVRYCLKDFSGRILEQGKYAAVKEKNISIPLTHVFTSFTTLRTELVKNGKIISSKELTLIIHDRDAKRVFSDGFILRMWGIGGAEASESTVREVNRQLEKIGVRFFNPSYTYHGVIDQACGMTSGGVFVGGGDIFCFGVGENKAPTIRKPSFNTSAMRKRIRENARRIAKTARERGYTFTCVCDEPNLSRPGGNFELDSHPENIAEYRKRMKAKYGSIENFNKKMGSKWASFDAVMPVLTAEARKTGRFGEFIEWRNFNTDRWCEVIKDLADASKSIAPHARFALTNSFGQGIYSGNDYSKLFRNAGLDFALEYTSAVYLGKNPIYNFDELLRSFNPAMPAWGSVGYNVSPDHITFTPWWYAAHRYGGMGWYAVTSGHFNLIDRPSLGLTKDAVLLGKSIENSKLQKGLGKLFITYPWAERDVAIYYSQSSMQTAFLLGEETRNGVLDLNSPLYNYFHSRQAVHFGLEALLYQYDFIPYMDVEEIAVEGRKKLILMDNNVLAS